MLLPASLLKSNRVEKKLLKNLTILGLLYFYFRFNDICLCLPIKSMFLEVPVFIKFVLNEFSDCAVT